MNKKQQSGVKIRAYREEDLDSLIRVYKSAFAEPPWNEYKKCLRCEKEYGREECRRIETGEAPSRCARCSSPLELAEFWSSDGIKGDLGFALSQPDPIVLVAESGGSLAGFSWGYRLPLAKFPFLGAWESTTLRPSYMDEIAVSAEARQRGIGTELCIAYMGETKRRGGESVVLRTDKRNASSVGLFRKVGFREIMRPGQQSEPLEVLTDPEFSNRVYFAQRVPAGAMDLRGD